MFDKKIADGLKRESDTVMKRILIFITLILAFIMCVASCNKKPNTDSKPEHTHEFGEWSITENATCTKDGVKVCYCSCGEQQTEIVPKLSHTVVIDEAVAPTCQRTGLTEGKHCSVCNEVIVAQTTVDAIEHTVVVDEAVAPTCTTTGLTEGKHCYVCNTVLVAQETIPAAHTIVIDAAVEPTCTRPGLTVGSHCSVCNKVISKQNEIPATGHEYNSKIIAPTCTAQGYTEYSCHCSDTYFDSYVNPLGHTEVIDKAVSSTCTATGLTEGKHCSVCHTVLIAQIKTPKASHSYDDKYDEVCNECGFTRDVGCFHENVTTIPAKSATCTEPGLSKGQICADCKEIITTQTVINPLGHKEKLDEAVMPTCTKTGLTAGYHCSVCDVVTVEQTVVPAKGHTATTTNAVPATCSETGLTEGSHCSVCDEILVIQLVTEKASHSYDDEQDEGCNECDFIREVACTHENIIYIPAVSATCTAPGLTRGEVCEDCEEVLLAQATVIALGHTAEIDNAVAPTCTKTGLAAGQHCSVCYEILVEQRMVDALGHSEQTDAEIAATCTKTGLTAGKHCSVCGEVLVEQIETPKISHSYDNKYDADCNKCGFTRDVECPHTNVEVYAQKDATCTEPGLTEGKVCLDCEKVIAEQTTTEALGHTKAIEAAVAPTCTKAGLTEGIYCSVCEEVFVEQASVAMLEHTESEWKVLRAPTEHEVGQKYTECVDCQKILNVVETPATHMHNYTEWIEVPSAGCSAFSYSFKYCLDCGNKVINAPEGADIVHPHDFEKTSLAATCTEEGIEYRFECKNCGFVAAEKIAPALGHDCGDNPCERYNEFYHTQKCNRCGEDVEKIHTLPVNWKYEKYPTCEDYGYTSGVCLKCGENQGIDLLPYGHLYVNATYINNSEHARECLRCGDVRISSHVSLTFKPVVEATCVSTGIDEGYCIYCNEHFTVVTTGYHDFKFKSFISGSCTEGGKINEICTVCDYENTIDLLAPGHFGILKETLIEPTCTTPGRGLYVCIRCGEEHEEALSPLGHLYLFGVDIELPDCYNPGLVRYTCQREGCSHIKEVTTTKKHNFYVSKRVNPTCTVEGEIVYTCGYCGVSVEYVLPVKHDLTRHEGTPATCTEGGRSPHYTCDDCGKYFWGSYISFVYLECEGREYLFRRHKITHYSEAQYDDTFIEAKGHIYPNYYNGYDEENHYLNCERCGLLLESEAHTMTDEWVVMTQIVPGGYKYYLVLRWDCTKCDYYYYENENTGSTSKPIEISEEHNTSEVIQPTLPTCTESGLDVGLKCGTCGEILYAQVELPALGHEYVGGVCIRCGTKNASQGLKFTLNGDGQSYSVTGIGTCTDTDIVIPDTYEGLPVTSIGNSAFNNKNSIRSITIPDSVTSIGTQAFFACKGLTSITIPDSVTSIDWYAFSRCSSLTSITVDENNANYKSIDGNLYTKDGKTFIQYAIGKTDASFTIPDSVTSTGREAFEYCTSLTSITIPDSVTRIGDFAFRGCSSLTNITVDENNKNYKSIDGNLYTKDKKALIEYAIGKTDASFTIPDSVTRIAASAFEYCSSLTSVTIGNSVKSIDYSAFSSCSSLTSVTIGNSVTSISSSVFAYCTSLTSVTIGNSVTSIGNYAFYDCSSLTSITIPDSVTSIGNYAFCGCESLTSVTIGNSVTSIGNYAFDGCTSLTSITIPDSVTTIGEAAFSSCSSLTSITIPDSVTSIGYYAFRECLSLSSITIPDSVTSIGNYAFYYCTSLTNITIPDSVTSIGNYAFYRCSSLTSITIPDSVTSIGSNAFSYCYKLVEVINHSSLNITVASEDYGYVGYYAKEVHNGESKIVNKDGYLFYTYDNVNYLLGYTGNDTELVLPDNYNGESYEIYEYAFYDRDDIVSVTIPDSVMSIGNSAFSSCSSLISITIGNSVTSIGAQAFQYCSNLRSVTIPDSVTSIGNYAFSNCTSLTNVTIGNSVTRIGDFAFRGCSKLVEVINHSSLDITVGSSNYGYIGCYAKEVHTGESKIVNQDGYLFYTYNGVNYLLGYTGNDTELVLPGNYNGESYKIYQYAFYYRDDIISITIPDSVTSIGGWAFSGCSSLTNVTIGNSVTSIGEYAFYYCSKLTSIIIPDSVTNIGYEAFRNCLSLTSVTIPDSVTSIGWGAYYMCDSLTSITIPDSVTSIGHDAFSGCSSLTTIDYDGTIAEWNAISKGSSWNLNTDNYTVYCTDGEIAKDGTVTYY